MPKLTRDDIETIIREWQTRLNLSHWRIKIDWESAPPEEADADFDASEWYDTATIRIRKDYETWDRREANVTVVHELIHCTMRDMRTAISSIQSKFSKATWEILDGWISAGEERAVEHLAQVLVNLGGVV